MAISDLVGQLPEVTEGEVFAREQQYSREKAKRLANRTASRARNNSPWPVHAPESVKLMANLRRIAAVSWDLCVEQLDKDVFAIRVEDSEQKHRPNR